MTRRDIRFYAPAAEVSEDSRVAVPELAPRRTLGGVVAVWVLAALMGVAVGVFAAEQWRGAWLAVGLGACLVAAFAVQLWSGRSQGFTERVAAGVLGSALVMGVISLGFGLASIVPG
ncbi:hypothetical protein [Microbacterium sp. HD4P20]|uniref:hypothetical protein n=1 Tax=Microbacterium sp. HD4P20 TaxID=2864874 RepID=UPI00264A4993|nr:hypothetical protein [Microbacterium sp. HD4P20]